MVHYIATKYYHVFLFLVFQFFILKSSSLIYLYRCPTNKTFTADSAYHFNLATLLASLSTAATTADFYNTTEGGRNADDTVYGLFNCRGDVPRKECRDCVAEATQKLASKCELQKEGMIWADLCFIRYSNHRFFSQVDEEPKLGIFSRMNVTNSTSFISTLATTLNDVVEEAASAGPAGVKKFAVKRVGLLNIAESESLYAMSECTRDLSSEDCRTCLRDALRDVPWCCLDKAGGEVAYPSCKIRFELFPFTWDIPPAKSPPPQGTPFPSRSKENKKGLSRIIIIAGVLLLLIAAMLSSFCCYWLPRKARNNNQKSLLRENFGHESVTLEALQFDLAIIEEATNNFSNENMIGKGGFGEVYKGILVDGRQIAVKRLSTRSTQGSIEFKNEILLIAKLQHRNLVPLIGFCLELQEKILIYEYMSNGSLDNILFGSMLDPKLFNKIEVVNSFSIVYIHVSISILIHLINIVDPQQKMLNWSERYKIIRGTALGILYLHEYSRLKVIHRDLKPSNILLDENMNPKISDFGMARIVEIDQDHAKTNRIVGTYGYMSPEYAMLGQFSKKSDVFSFGVMVLEIITGKKNANSYESDHTSKGLMSHVWRQWKDQIPLSILDANMKENYSQIDVIKCIHIGLLCVQENPNARPTMATIVSYLNNDTPELPPPQEPAFSLHGRTNKKLVMQQESSSGVSTNNSVPLLSVNEMSITNFYPR